MGLSKDGGPYRCFQIVHPIQRVHIPPKKGILGGRTICTNLGLKDEPCDSWFRDKSSHLGMIRAVEALGDLDARSRKP